MVFLKYFYFLNVYSDASPPIVMMLDFLTRHKRLIGLDEISSTNNSILTLLKYFAYDGSVAILACINIYIGQFKEYESFRQIVMLEEGNMQKSLLEIEEEPEDEEQR